jgi:hypothetical protein
MSPTDLLVPTLVFLAGAFALAAPAHADSWVRPQVREVFSADRDHFVRVIPGDSWGDVTGFAGSAGGGFAGAAKGPGPRQARI